MVGAMALAAGVAAAIAFLELWNNQYPGLLPLVAKQPGLYAICALHGVLAGAAFAFLKVVGVPDSLSGNIPANDWVLAAAVGFGARGFFRLSFFEFRVQDRKLSIGPELVLNLIEPRWLNDLMFSTHLAREKLLDDTAARYPDVESVKEKINSSTPRGLSGPTKSDLTRNLSGADSSKKAMDAFLEVAGVKAFRKVFPA